MATGGNPLLMQLMQRLSQGRGGPGGPGGAPGGPLPGRGGPPGLPPGLPPGIGAAQSMAQTPYGQESQDLDELKSKVGTLINRVLQRSSDAAQCFIKAYRELEKGGELLSQLPAAPVGAPPPGLPFMGGPGMTPPMDDAAPPAFM